MILVNLIQSASAFHQYDRNILLQCNSTAMWLNNINCPEFKTGGELFQIKVLELLMIFQNIWSCFISFLESLIHISASNKLNEFNSDNSLFIELLPLLAGFDIAVLSFALPLFEQLQNKTVEKFNLRSKSQKLKDEHSSFISGYKYHLICTFLLIALSPFLKGTFVMLIFIPTWILTGFSISDIGRLIKFMLKLLQSENINDDFIKPILRELGENLKLKWDDEESTKD